MRIKTLSTINEKYEEKEWKTIKLIVKAWKMYEGIFNWMLKKNKIKNIYIQYASLIRLF